MENKVENKKRYDLEDRSRAFARDIRVFVKLLPKNQANFEDSKQLVRSSGSVGANYIEANESLSKKDFLMRVRIARKEAKESKYWLELLDTNEIKETETSRRKLLQEATELMMILSAIMRKSEV